LVINTLGYNRNALLVLNYFTGNKNKSKLDYSGVNKQISGIYGKIHGMD